jgi:isopropylmalate/homocitrate/citramalate synthase
MSEPIRVVVPFDINRCSPNKRHSRDGTRDTHARRAQKNALIDAARWAWKAAGRPQAAGPVTYRVLVRRSAAIEDDNAIAACKAARDALFCGKRFADDGGAITPNDTAAWVRFERLEQEVKRAFKGREEVVFEVYPREGAGC